MSLREKISKITHDATAPMERFALGATGVNTLLACIAMGAIGPVGPIGFLALPAAVILTGTTAIVLGAKLIGEKPPTVLEAAKNVTAFMAATLVIAGSGVKSMAAAFFGKPPATCATTNPNASIKTPCPSCVSKIAPVNVPFNNAVSPAVAEPVKAAPAAAPTPAIKH